MIKGMKIRYSIYNLVLQAKTEINLPPYKGSTFRGAFGVAFRRVVCALKKESCDECLLNRRCVYSYIFESRPDEDIHIFGRVSSIPRPFVIEPPVQTKTLFGPGESIAFNLLLIGRAIEYLPYFIYAFDELGSIGIGKGRGKFILKEIFNVTDGKRTRIYSVDSKTVLSPDSSEIDLKTSIENVLNGSGYTQEGTSITLRFETPTRIKYQRHLTKDLQFHILIRQLLRRIFLLWHFHCEGDGTRKELRDYHRVMINTAQTVSIKNSTLYWHDWQRYSYRQGMKIRMGGFIGEINYEGVLSPFMPFLHAGEILHVGKGTTFGLGKYKIV